MREKQNPVEKEWAAVVKAEERFLRHAMPARTAGWQEKITRYVPQKLEATLHTAFYKAFELIFDKGTPVIEKTCQKEKKEQNYKINAYAAEVRDTRHALRAFGREAGASRNLNLAVSAVEGVGMGFFGLGLPDIPLFLGVLLKSIYEVALSYGYTYDTQEEQIFILKLIETALSHGEQLAQNNMELNLWMREERTFSISRNEQIRRTSDALAGELLYLKFVQGLPVVGMVGGVIIIDVNIRFRQGGAVIPDHLGDGFRFIIAGDQHGNGHSVPSFPLQKIRVFSLGLLYHCRCRVSNRRQRT